MINQQYWLQSSMTETEKEIHLNKNNKSYHNRMFIKYMLALMILSLLFFLDCHLHANAYEDSVSCASRSNEIESKDLIHWTSPCPSCGYENYQGISRCCICGEKL